MKYAVWGLLLIACTAWAEQMSPTIDWEDGIAVYEYRAELMKRNKKHMERLNQAVRALDWTVLKPLSADILETYELLPKLFSKDSDVPGSESRPEIWTQPEKFAAMVEESQRAARAFASAVEKQDARLTQLHFRELGQTCRSCHASFRN